MSTIINVIRHVLMKLLHLDIKINVLMKMKYLRIIML